ncbi:serine protease SP24D-like [Choristoneura fumiferana]|uniref:serine protease SP24D-like n=1 Tax=Choristoneura fumiferana TaxID=7141 RepID=UPI003D15C067
MCLKRRIQLLLVSFLLTTTAEGQLIERLRQRDQIGLERYPTGINLSSGSEQCEPMTFSLPKPETGCCGLHKFDETNFRAGKRLYKRNVQDEEIYEDGEMSDGNDSEDEHYYEYEYNSSELKNDTLPESRRKRDIIDGFINPPSKFIVAGSTADISYYPWIVHLEILIRRTNYISTCGGSLINSKFVLTAGHCMPLELQSLNDIKVVLAEYDTRTPSMDCISYSNGERKCVNNVVMNPEQIFRHPQGHDIAILRLRGIAPYSEFIRPICLPPFNIDTPRNRDLELVVAGWGALYETSPGHPLKQFTTVNLVPLQECSLLSNVPPEMICAIGHNGQDACYGDSGGPLMAYYNGNYILVGIVSGKHVVGAHCGSQVPTSYVNVYLYLNWIQSVMKPY